MRVLALDPATKTGWSIMDSDHGLLASGVWNLSPRRHESQGMRGVKLRSSLSECVKAFEPDLIAYEEVARHRATHAAHVYGGLVMTIQVWAEDNGIEYTAFPVKEIKKWATGNGNANKERMCQEAAERWPGYRDEWDDNEADACLIGAMAIATYAEGL